MQTEILQQINPCICIYGIEINYTMHIHISLRWHKHRLAYESRYLDIDLLARIAFIGLLLISCS